MERQDRKSSPLMALLIALILCLIAYAFVYWGGRSLSPSAADNTQTIGRPTETAP
jgi:hypothetical protein